MTKKVSAVARRVERYLSRQDPERPAWGADYEPANRASREESPATSRPSILNKRNKVGRELHAQSLPERMAILLALYAPNVFDLNEQRVLCPFRAVHPLHGHPRAKGQALTHFQGTVAVADRLGYHDFHQRFSFQGPNRERLYAPVPLVGDLLLFIEDADGVRCVNWSVKQAMADFERSGPTGRPIRDPVKARERAVARQLIEAEYYADAGIPTRLVAASDLHPELARNLELGFVAAQMIPALPKSLGTKLLTLLRAAVRAGQPPLLLAEQCSLQYGLTYEHLRDFMFAAIWNRDLRVDLYSPIFPDLPLPPERQDVLADYAHLFKGDCHEHRYAA